MSKRLTQLFARYIGAALLALTAKLGVEDDGTIVANVEVIAAGIAAVIAFVVDVLMHRAATGSVLKPASKDSQVSKLLILGLCVLGASGCTMSDSQRYAMISSSYQATANTTATLIRSGAISDQKDLEDIRVINNELKVELDAMHAALVNTVPLDFQFVMRRVEALLGRLIQYQLDNGDADDTGPSPGTSIWPYRLEQEDRGHRQAGERGEAGPHDHRAQRGEGREHDGVCQLRLCA